MREDVARGEIVEVGRRLYDRALISGNEGNVSVRLGDALLVTPPGVCKGFLTPEMIVKTDLAGRPTDGRRASTEVLMHTAVYRRRPDALAVVHAHPPVATAFAVAGIALDQPLIAEAVVTLGKVPVIPYGTPSTAELADNVGAAVCQAQALLLANHGALAVGDSLYRAWERMEALEQVAKITLVSRLLGVTHLLPANDVARLVEMRPRAGYPEPVCAPGPAPAAGSAPSPPVPSAAGASPDTVVLSRAELVRLVTEAVERFRR
jgi:L-fuculose-phosphate aldolase